MHASRSETIGQLLPSGVERQLRAQLRALRFGQPQEYAQLEQAEVHKFLGSKAVHHWLSEWELSRQAFGRNGSLPPLDPRRHRQQRHRHPPPPCWATSSYTADAAVQCVPAEIDAEWAAHNAAMYPPAQQQANGGPFQRHPTAANGAAADFWRGSFSQQPYWHHPFPPLMDASTNTQTTETTAGTGGMNIYRRASYLEEYAMERVREMEAEKEAKEARERERELERKRRRRAAMWRRCFCCCCGRRQRSSSEDRTSSTSFPNNSSNSTTKKFSSNTQGGTFDDQLSSAARREGRWQRGGELWAVQPSGVSVKKFTLTSSAGGAAGGAAARSNFGAALRFNAPMPGGGYQHGVVTGNYENVTPPPPSATDNAIYF